jgi:hypothetical protein
MYATGARHQYDSVYCRNMCSGLKFLMNSPGLFFACVQGSQYLYEREKLSGDFTRRPDR